MLHHPVVEASPTGSGHKMPLFEVQARAPSTGPLWASGPLPAIDSAALLGLTLLHNSSAQPQQPALGRERGCKGISQHGGSGWTMQPGLSSRLSPLPLHAQVGTRLWEPHPLQHGLGMLQPCTCLCYLGPSPPQLQQAPRLAGSPSNAPAPGSEGVRPWETPRLLLRFSPVGPGSCPHVLPLTNEQPTRPRLILLAAGARGASRGSISPPVSIISCCFTG